MKIGKPLFTLNDFNWIAEKLVANENYSYIFDDQYPDIVSDAIWDQLSTHFILYGMYL